MGSPKFRSAPEPRATPTFLLLVFDDGLSKPQLQANFEVAGFVYYGNIKESVLTTNSLFEPSFGELEVTYGHYL